MENSKLLTVLVEVDEGTKTPYKAHNEILSLFGVSQQRELLIAYMDFIFDDCTDGDKESIDEFIEQNSN